MTEPFPNIFPQIGPATRFALLTDFAGEMSHPSGDEWRNEIDVLVSQGLAGIAQRVVREHSLKLDGAITTALQNAQFRGMAETAFVVKQSFAGLEVLQKASIPFVITKGPGIALECAAITDRSFVDLDVVVEPSQFRDALRVLRSEGYAERKPTVQPWDSFNRFCREAINLRNESGGSIDLHHRVSPWYWSTGLTFDRLFEDAQTRETYGFELPIASPLHNLMVAALHVVSDKSRPGQTLKAWRDLLVLANRSSAESVIECAEATGMAAWLRWILGCLPERLVSVGLLDGLASRGPELKGKFRLREILPPRMGSEHPMVARALRLPLPHAVYFVAGTFVPSASYLRHRYPDQSHRYLSWWRESPENFRQEPIVQAGFRNPGSVKSNGSLPSS
jgi:hypothetical protein